MAKAKSKKRADGRLMRSVTDKRTGKRVYFYGKTEREINQKIMEFTEIAGYGRTFSQVADEWWEITEPTLSPNSVHTYHVPMRRAVAEFGNDRLKDITTHDIQLFITRFAGTGKNAKAKKTVSNQLMVIGLIFKHGIVSSDCEINPAQFVIIPKNLKTAKRTAAGKGTEQIIKENVDKWLFPYFVLYTGMRKGEALAITGADINLEEKTISVTKSVYYKSNKAYIKPPKTEAGIRIVPILEPLLGKLPHIEDDEYLFPSALDPKQPMGYSLFNCRIKRYRKATGTKFCTHQLRHSFATILYECGVDAKTSQHLLGHAQISTTLDTYTDFRKSHAAIADQLNEKLQKSE